MTDFVVIGGGIAGVSAAAHLAPHGSVMLFEKEPGLAYHTSGRSAAMLVESHGSPATGPLVKAARSFLDKPPEGSVDSPLLSERGVVWVTADEGITRLEEKANGAGLLAPDQVLELVPVMRRDWLAGGLREPSGADIDVAGLHQAFVRIASKHGTEIETSSPVTAIDSENGRWSVTAGRHRQTCEVIVNASGAWGDVIARMAGVAPIGLQPMRRTAFMVPGGHESSGWPMVVEVDEDFYFRPDGVQFLCSLAEEVPSEPTDARPRMEDVALAIEKINTATTLEIRTVNSQWTGLRTFAPDRSLVVGEDPLAPGFWWLVGQGGVGIQTSPAYGALLASLALGLPLPASLSDAGVDPTLTSPSRFRQSVS